MCKSEYIYKPVYRIHDAAKLLGVGITQIYNLVKEGKLTKVTHDKLSWITGSSLRDFINSLT